MTVTVRITHYGHACVLAELPDSTRILFDAGTRVVTVRVLDHGIPADL
jgi:L-ascorbate metabolism protein UlaG (beta-lactamase superfamily)